MFSRRSAFALCISLLFANLAWAQGGTDWVEEARAAKTKEEFSRVLDRVEPTLGDVEWTDSVRTSLKIYGLETARREFESNINADRIEAAKEAKGPVADPSAEAREILSGPMYRDGGTSQSNNWLGKAGQSVGEWIGKILADFFSMFRAPSMAGPSLPALGMGAMASQIFMVVLGLALIAFVIYFATKISMGRKTRRKTGGILDDDEPDRTADEWLQQADLLASEGRYREAVRCLYIACLVRFDDAGVAAFDRGQTNWEHLYRIHESPKKPMGLDFRGPTKSFDLFWYGYAPITADDVAEFRRLYDGLLHDLGIRGKAA